MDHPLAAHLPASWLEVLAPRVDSDASSKLLAFVAAERARFNVFPPAPEVFAAFHATPFDDVAVVLVGQDPYHRPGQAHGLAFSVRPGTKVPPSLANMYKELVADIGCAMPRDGSLVRWATSGVFLLNTVLTVREGEPGSHAKKGWEAITDAAIDAVSARTEPAVFVLWGAHARAKAKRIDLDKHRVIEGVHPSPLSAHGGFFGSRPYSAINAALVDLGRPAIDWSRAGSG